MTTEIISKLAEAEKAIKTGGEWLTTAAIFQNNL